MGNLGQTMLAKTKASLAGNHALLVASRHQIAASRRRLNPWFTLAGGSDSDRLRGAIGVRLATGRLFRADGRRAWAGHGTGRPCVVCEEPITTAQVEYEVSSAIDGASASAHLRCYMMWKEESELPPRPSEQTSKRQE